MKEVVATLRGPRRINLFTKNLSYLGGGGRPGKRKTQNMRTRRRATLLIRKQTVAQLLNLTAGLNYLGYIYLNLFSKTVCGWNYIGLKLGRTIYHF